MSGYIKEAKKSLESAEAASEKSRPLLPSLSTARFLIAQEYGDEYGDEFDKLLAAHDREVAAESILDSFSYENWEEGDDDQLRIGDYLYASRELPPAMNEEGFYAKIIIFNDEYLGVKDIPALLIQSKENPDGEFASLLDVVLHSYMFTRISEQDYLLATNAEKEQS